MQKALKNKRITRGPDGGIDFARADRDWAANTDTGRLRQPVKEPFRKKPPPKEFHDIPYQSRESATATGYASARAIRETYLARMAKLDFEEREGRLLDRDKVRAEAFNLFRIVRDSMLNVADRVSALLAAESDTARCHDILSTEIRGALSGLTNPVG